MMQIKKTDAYTDQSTRTSEATNHQRIVAGIILAYHGDFCNNERSL